MHTRNKSTITTNEIKKVVVPVPGHVHVRYLYRRNTHLWTLYVCTHEIFFLRTWRMQILSVRRPRKRRKELFLQPLIKLKFTFQLNFERRSPSKLRETEPILLKNLRHCDGNEFQCTLIVRCYPQYFIENNIGSYGRTRRSNRQREKCKN
jgi:hypothetical protein